MIRIATSCRRAGLNLARNFPLGDKLQFDFGVPGIELCLPGVIWSFVPTRVDRHVVLRPCELHCPAYYGIQQVFISSFRRCAGFHTFQNTRSDVSRLGFLLNRPDNGNNSSSASPDRAPEYTTCPVNSGSAMSLTPSGAWQYASPICERRDRTSSHLSRNSKETHFPAIKH